MSTCRSQIFDGAFLLKKLKFTPFFSVTTGTECLRTLLIDFFPSSAEGLPLNVLLLCVSRKHLLQLHGALIFNSEQTPTLPTAQETLS
jgi:hypothetical protein